MQKYNGKALKKKIFEKKTLKRISFIKSNLKKTIFRNCNLDECDFWEANLSQAKFENTKFKDCVFTDTDLTKTHFKKTFFINSNLSHTRLKGVNFKNSKLKNVNLRDAIFDKNTLWPKKFNPLSYGAIKDLKQKKIVKKNSFKRKKIVKDIGHELTKGKGYFVIKNYFNKQKIKKAFDIIKKRINHDKNFRTKKFKFSRDKKLNQKYVYNLINLNKIFVELIQPKLAMEVFRDLLGDKFICGFFAANCLMPGAKGQFPHIDYPYIDMVKPGTKIPFDTGKNFLFNCQILIPLNDINKENGATAYLKNSHKFRKFPDKDEIKKRKFEQIELSTGSILISNGLMWHAAMPNYTYDKYRFCILGQYLPYFIKPMLNLKKTTKKTIIKKDKKLLNQLLGIGLKHPDVRY